MRAAVRQMTLVAMLTAKALNVTIFNCASRGPHVSEIQTAAKVKSVIPVIHREVNAFLPVAAEARSTAISMNIVVMEPVSLAAEK